MPTTWILVADGARARIWTSERPRHLETTFSHDFASPVRNHAREAGSDRPGRTFDSAGQGRHAMEPPTDWKDNEKREFARALAERLREGVLSGACDRLVIVAPPQFLGLLRAQIDKETARRVEVEIGKDLTHLSEDHELLPYLDDALRPGLRP
ncbi:MAG: host attachment protein [Alphaproteobacteria bacterium]|nr:host attachment protein [Alphaproteobacteria bacterium]